MKKSKDIRRTAVVILLIFALISLLFVMPVSAEAGEVVVWGNDNYGQCTDAPTEENFKQVAAGWDHALAVKEDGSIVAWGNNYAAQCDVPAGNEFVQAAAGASHSLALTENGTIVAWGANNKSQCEVPTGDEFKQISSGAYHNLALTSNGTIKAWGYDLHGEVSNTPTENGYRQVCAGDYHNIALMENGSIVSWGYNYYNVVNGVPAGDNFVQVAAGLYHSMALRSDGSVVTWGKTTGAAPTGTDFKQIDSALFHNLALKSDGSIMEWGLDNYYPCSDIPSGNGFVQVAAGRSINLAIKLLPVAFITAESSCNVGSEIIFDASASSNTDEAAEYVWEFGDGDTGSGAMVSHVYEDSGEYEVTLTVINLNGQADTETITILVKPITAAVSIKPETFNLGSHGIITVFITLPESYNVAGIDDSTVRCEGVIAEKCMLCDEDPTKYLAKFDRDNFVDVQTGDEVEFIVCGKFSYNGYLIDFEGSDTIRVMEKGNQNMEKGNKK